MNLQADETALRDQAAHWFVVLASGEVSAEERTQWQRWRTTSAAHEAAWQLAEMAVGRFAGVPQDLKAASSAILGKRPPRRRQAVKQLLVFFGIGVLALGGYRASLHMDWTADAVTAVGEQRSVALADGSRMVLDTDTAVDIEFTDSQRLIHLRRGQLMIETAPDNAASHRDFIVATHEGRARALGTRFTVQQADGATQVAVLEAHVAIQPGAAEAEAGIVSAGESVRFDRKHILQTTNLRPDEASWPDGMLIVNAMRLDEFVARLARYRQTPLSCSPEVADLQISGAFPLDSTDRVLEALARTLPVRVADLGRKGSQLQAR